MRKALTKLGYDLVYINAPVSVSLADLPFGTAKVGGNTEDGTLRSWWPNSPSDPQHYSLDLAFDTVRKSIEEKGPYAGVLGFSQGAAFAGILCQHMHKLHSSQPPLEFGILYSGFRIERPEHEHYFESKITVPTLHIIGTLDTVVSEERSVKLYDACDESSRTMITHPGGHYVPSAKNILQDVVSWTVKTSPCEAESKTDAKVDANANANETEAWDEFDKIGAV